MVYGLLGEKFWESALGLNKIHMEITGADIQPNLFWHTSHNRTMKKRRSLDCTLSGVYGDNFHLHEVPYLMVPL